MLALLPLLAAFSTAVFAQTGSDLPSSFPHVYPGQPRGDYSPRLAKVLSRRGSTAQRDIPRTQQLRRTLECSAQGIRITRSSSGHREAARLADKSQKHRTVGYLAEWGVSHPPQFTVSRLLMLHSRPGSSSLIGFFLEVVASRMGRFGCSKRNHHLTQSIQLDKVSDFVWIDQPVGVGWSTADAAGYIPDEDQMGADFVRVAPYVCCLAHVRRRRWFLGNLVKVFPELAHRPLHLTGESYAGVYIPYIMKAYFSMSKPP
ncbi:unnamed protein product [Mycena citricolor]|uniref:Carboxypeptidase n=1 Tax=Mycena citricolor TaxID=2018698 RepID=A0AAD2H3Z9_9AGAR|nr:unnamed protein product [Mycena citricolor]